MANMTNQFDELMQVEMAIKAAERMVGQATMSMDEDQLQAATDALNQAKMTFQKAAAYQTGIDERFFELSSDSIHKIDVQLNEAKKD